MNSDALAAAGNALYGPRWQTAMARLLGVDDRTVRRWLAGDRAIPEGVGTLLGRLLDGDEWIAGDGTRTGAEYVIHTRWPRFIARVVDEEAETTILGDHGADPLGGVTYAGANGLLCEIAWHDPPPAGEALETLLQRADDALGAMAETHA